MMEIYERIEQIQASFSDQNQLNELFEQLERSKESIIKETQAKFAVTPPIRARILIPISPTSPNKWGVIDSVPLSNYDDTNSLFLTIFTGNTRQYREA